MTKIAEKFLQIKELSKKFGGINALDKVTIEIDSGKIIAIIGPNGSGKSTLFNAICGLIKVDGGEIYFENEDLRNMKDFEVARMGISRTFQEVRLFKSLTIKEHLEIALSDDDEKFFKSLGATEINKEKKMLEILDIVGLDKEINTLSSELSYGQRKLLDLAVAITRPHKLLMLDEPVAGINPELRKYIKKIINRMKKEGKTILLIEHDMNFVTDIADYIYVLDYGKLIAQGRPKEIQKNPRVLEAYLGG